MTPQVQFEQLNGSDCLQLLIIRLAAEVVMVKHDLTVGVASECAIDALSERAFREFSLHPNALACRVTRATQRLVFCGWASQAYPQDFLSLHRCESRLHGRCSAGLWRVKLCDDAVPIHLVRPKRCRTKPRREAAEPGPQGFR